MLTNADITIFNRYVDLKMRKTIYIPHHVERVWFNADQKSTVSDGGIVSANEYKIRIPYSECDSWLPENDFLELETPGDNWTVQKNDMFILGKWNGGSVDGIEDIRKEFSGMVGKILSHSENFFGSQKHIRIGGGD